MSNLRWTITKTNDFALNYLVEVYKGDARVPSKLAFAFTRGGANRLAERLCAVLNSDRPDGVVVAQGESS